MVNFARFAAAHAKTGIAHGPQRKNPKRGEKEL